MDSRIWRIPERSASQIVVADRTQESWKGGPAFQKTLGIGSLGESGETCWLCFAGFFAAMKTQMVPVLRAEGQGRGPGQWWERAPL